MNEKDPIGKALDIAPVPEAQPQLPDVFTNASSVVTNTDVDLAQDNLKELATKGTEALDQIMEVASLSQHPRAYEVVATTLATLADINKKIVDNVKAKKELNEPAANAAPKSVTNQNVFVGSTAELMALLAGARNGRSS